MRSFLGFLALIIALPAVAGDGTDTLPEPSVEPVIEAPAEVKVELVKPKKEKLPTLRFLSENRDFLRGRMDVLRQVPVSRDEQSVAMNDRFLTYQEMLADLAAARDTMDAIDKVEDQEFLTSVTQLGDLESELDLLAGLLSEQEARLWGLQNDFLGREQTALLIVIRGSEQKTPPPGLILTDGYGDAIHVDMTPEKQAGLDHGGVVQVFHGFVEPRVQTWELAFTGEGWTGSEPVYLSFEPSRNQLTLMELDVTDIESDTGATHLKAQSWIHHPGSPTSD